MYDFITDKAVVENGNKFKADSFDAELFKRSDSIIEQSKNDILETVAEDQMKLLKLVLNPMLHTSLLSNKLYR